MALNDFSESLIICKYLVNVYYTSSIVFIWVFVMFTYRKKIRAVQKTSSAKLVILLSAYPDLFIQLEEKNPDIRIV